METSLHRDLKRLYAGSSGQTEVRLGRHIIDAVVDGQLIEIQHGALAAIRDKIRTLCETHHVRVVKPLIARKTLLKLDRRGGAVVERRASPKRQTWLDLFDEFVHFTRAFPHPRLTIEVVMVEVEERRYPGHGRRRRHRANDFIVEDQQLIAVHETIEIATPCDLLRQLGIGNLARREYTAEELPKPFHTGDLATALSIPRWRAQQISYVLRACEAIKHVGKRGNAMLYALAKPKRKRVSRKRAA